MLSADAFPHLVPCTIRDYTAADRDACAQLYASHVPGTYSEAYLTACLKFLDEGTSYHLVVENEGGEIVGCGGLELRGEGPFAHLIYGFIHKNWQGRGFGATLLAARLSLIENEGETVSVHLEAGTDVAGFYGRHGFKLAAVRANGLGTGRDTGHLILQITPEEVENLRARLGAAGVEIVLTEPEMDDEQEEA